MTPPGLHVRNASLTFGQRALFSKLECEFPASSWTCLLGRSGSGKSSLLRMIAGLHLPDNHHLDLTTSDGEALRGRLAWMAQQDLLVPWERVLGNVMLGARWRGERSASAVARAREMLALVGLAERADAWPAALSGGQRQRVSLARTLFEDASVVLMDEPFSAVDAITRLELHELAYRLLAERTVIMVTHDPLEALRLAERILVLKGDPARLVPLAAPETPRPRALDDAEVQTRQTALVAELRETADAQ
ncbi:ABC transporter ATP-binding protein [Salinicola rhizosphaerae]|uniref:ABC transporter n=1 Tax=Salinicola rhizosphaerae TaxID=1443141 RepID=A0ABQ3DP58_9GAMM|nr:ABC transporter ATP-binding protein [Salinicola rhizosphaerae]GHB08885.1 ABC transporter [Salinicola rhizosphaerae]